MEALLNTPIQEDGLTLGNYLSHLKIENERLSTELDRLQRTQMATATGSHESNPRLEKEKVNMPDEFKGDPKEMRIFLHQCQEVFEAQPTIYSTDESKIRFTGSFCRGSAAKWYQSCKESNLLQNKSYAYFKKQLTDAYGDMDPHQHALQELGKLRQSGRCSTYVTEFNILANRTKLNDTAKLEIFKRKLKDELLDLLVTFPDTDILFEYQKYAIKADDRIFQRKSEKALSVNPVKYFSSNTTRNNNQVGPTPMQIDNLQLVLNKLASRLDSTTEVNQMNIQQSWSKRRGLTIEEKQHRKDNHLCAYCGKGDCGGFPDVEKCHTLVAKNQGKGQRRSQ